MGGSAASVEPVEPDISIYTSANEAPAVIVDTVSNAGDSNAGDTIYGIPELKQKPRYLDCPHCGKRVTTQLQYVSGNKIKVLAIVIAVFG